MTEKEALLIKFIELNKNHGVLDHIMIMISNPKIDKEQRKAYQVLFDALEKEYDGIINMIEEC